MYLLVVNTLQYMDIYIYIYRLCKLVLVDLRRYLHVGEGSLEREEVYAHGCASLGLQNELIGNGTFVRLVRIPLAIVDARLHHPLLIEGREASGLIEQLVHILICAIRLHLQI